MTGSDISAHVLTVGALNAAEQARIERRAAIRAADHVAAEHPDPRDDVMPKLAGRELAKNPDAAAGVLELLDALGLRPDQVRRRT